MSTKITFIGAAPTVTTGLDVVNAGPQTPAVADQNLANLRGAVDGKMPLTGTSSAVTFGAVTATSYNDTGNSVFNKTSGNVLIGTTTENVSGGCLQLKSGITFPATQVTSSDPNTLDDYEEGTFTPVLTGSTGGTRAGTGKYQKIGNKVTIRISSWGAISANTFTGYLSITGLPFAAITVSSSDDFSQSNGLLHIRYATTAGTAGAPFAIINITIINLHSSASLGSGVVRSSTPTFPATGITQNGLTSVGIDWYFTYFV